MAKIRNELKIAITIIVSIIVAILGFRVMRDNPLFRQSHVIYAYFERVDGLNVGNYIYINGVKVGSVKSIRLQNTDSVRVALGFDLGIKIPRGSAALLQSAGLLDDKAIIVEKGDSEEAIEYGGTMEGIYEGGMMETLKDEGEKLSSDISSSFDKLSNMLEHINSILTEENKNNISSALSNVESTTNDLSGMLQEKRNELEESIDHLNSFLSNIDTLSTNNRETLDSALVRMNRSLEELETLSRNMSETSGHLNTMLKKINEGEGSMGQMVNNPSLYNNLDSLSVELKSLIKNINENPRKYLKHMRLIEVF